MKAARINRPLALTNTSGLVFALTLASSCTGGFMGSSVSSTQSSSSASQGETGPVVTPSTSSEKSNGVSRLTWAPPVLENPETIILTEAMSADQIQLDNTKDYKIVCDPSNNGKLVTKRVMFMGGRNITMIGCSIQRTPNSANSVYPGTGGACANISNPVGTLSFTKQTGTVYLEGVLVDLQNTITNYHNYGVDAIDLGNDSAYLTAALSGSVVGNETLQLRVSNATTLSEAAGQARTLTLPLASGSTPDAVATQIAAAINADTVLSTNAITAAADGAAVTFAALMPLGNQARVTLQTAGGSALKYKLSRSNGTLRGATYVLQNIRTENTWSTICGHHADALQAQSDISSLFIDRFTAGSVGYQGIQLQPSYALLDIRLYNLNTRYMDPDTTHTNVYGDPRGANGVGWWLGAGVNAGPYCDGCTHSYDIQNNFAEERTGMGGWAAYSVAPPTQAAYGAEIYQGNPDVVYFPHVFDGLSIKGTVQKGVPVTGDFVPRSRIVDPTGKVVYKPVADFSYPSP